MTMSSTSSSECMCNACLNYAPSFRAIRTPAPYYQTMGQPLIYYAQVLQPSKLRQNRESKKGGPNCFVKAFRWYTRDHHPPESRELPRDRTDLAGFAVWLDKKYDEFLIEKRDDVSLQPKPTVDGVPDGSNVQMNFDHNQQKNIANIKSPRKRRRSAQNTADTTERCNQSFEYILKPKELSRAASERFHQNLSNDTQMSKRTIVTAKARSSERFSEKTESVPNDMITIDTNKCTEKASKTNKPAPKTIEYKEPKTKRAPSHSKSLNDVLCQCPEEKIVMVDTETHCTDENTNEIMASNCCQNCRLKIYRDDIASSSQKRDDASQIRPHGNSKKNINKDTMKSQDRLCECDDDLKRLIEKKCLNSGRDERDTSYWGCFCTNDDELIKSSRAPSNSVQPPKDMEIVVENQIDNDKKRRITFNSNSAQTSDHAISLEAGGYPLFMKIMRADKLNEDLS